MGEAALGARPASANEEALEREPPSGGEPLGEGLGRILAAPGGPIGVAGDVRESEPGRSRDNLEDERRELSGQAAQAALLPARNEDARGPLVDDRRSGRRERQPTAGTLDAARDGPGGRSAAR